MAENFVGGGLKLKGGISVSIGKKKKKKKKKDKKKELEETLSGDEEDLERKKAANVEKLEELQEEGHNPGEMTLAEKAFELAKKKREKNRIQKAVSMTHRERMEAFNTHLGSLSEHMDIPKVGPG